MGVVVVGMGGDRSTRRCRGRTQVRAVVIINDDDGFARRVHDDV